MPWDQLLTWTFLISIATAGIRLAVPILLAVLGEIITERSGVMNLGLEGIMLVGGLAGFTATFAMEQAALVALAPWIGLLVGLLAGALMGLLMAVLTVSLRTDQVVTGVTLVLLGQGLTAFMYRRLFGSVGKRVQGLDTLPIPGLSQVPVVGDIFFNHNLMVYATALLVAVCWFGLFRTNWGLNLRAVGENPAAAATSGLNVVWIRYLCVVGGAALTGLGGAVLTVVQLHLFTEGVTAGRGWIAIALVVFSRWQPVWAMLGAISFGMVDALQFRIQTLGSQEMPYELLLLLPYALALVVLSLRNQRNAAPNALGVPYLKS
ncbi:MAG: ABC transporter permease [Verrucomicrobia bacterium]|nr:ABC transporter permease [Leptolyngbya sp. ES-bin-22]